MLERIRARGCDGLYRDSDTKIIYFRKFRKGRGEWKRSLKTTELEKAKEERDRLVKELAEKTAHDEVIDRQAKTALELLDASIDRKLTMNRAPATMVSIRVSREFLAPYFETMLPDQITAEWWETVYIPEIRAKTHKERKFFNDRKWLIGFLRQLRDDGLINQVPKLLNPDSKESIGKVYSDGEVTALLMHAQNEDLHLAILMAATMGMRRGEIFGLRLDRVNLTKRTISLKDQDTKIRRGRTFAISPAAFQLIEKRAQNGSEWIFPSKEIPGRPLHKDGYTKAWRNLRKICGITGRFHDLRHTFLTKAFNASGANAAQICAYAGLSLQVAERTYLHLTEDDSRRVSELVRYD